MHLKYAYGFTCDCPCCQSPFSIDSDRYKKQEELSSLETRLQDVLELKYQDPQNSKGKVPDLKLDIIPGLPSTYLPSLSEEFSQASHWRDYNLAIQKGKSLLGLYFLLYSANYPMIGGVLVFHLLNFVLIMLLIRTSRTGAGKDLLECVCHRYNPKELSDRYEEAAFVGGEYSDHFIGQLGFTELRDG